MLLQTYRPLQQSRKVDGAPPLSVVNRKRYSTWKINSMNVMTSPVKEPGRRNTPPISLLAYLVAAWRSGNIVGRINEVTVRRARLVLGWVTCPGSTPGGGTSFRYVTSHPGRLSLSSFRGR